MNNSPHTSSSIPVLARFFPRPAAMFCLLLCVAMVATAGCRSGPDKKAEARAQWNTARARVLLGLADDQFEQGNLSESRKTCSEALRLTDRLPDLYVLKAKLDIEEGDLMQARDALDAALTLQPGNPLPHYLKGIIAERWREPAEALVHYQTAADAEPGELAYLLATAEMLVELDRTDEAGEMLEARLIYFESNAPIRDMLAQIRLEQERYDEAADLFRRAAILAPTEGIYRQREALAVLQAGRAVHAAGLLERLLEDQANADQVSLHLALGEAQLQAGKSSAARATFQKATRLDDDNLMAWMGLAKATVETGEAARAELAMSRVAGLDPTPRQAADVSLLRGYLRLKQDKVSDAARAFAEAGRLDPSDPMALVMYGICLERQGRPQEAADCWGRALELDPSDPLAREMLNRHIAAETDPIVP